MILLKNERMGFVSNSEGLTEVKSDKKAIAGFALMELITAIAVTSIALGAIFSTFYYGLRQIKGIYNMAIATSSAQTEMEIIRNIPFSQLTNRREAPFIGEVMDLEELREVETKLTIEDYPGEIKKLKKIAIDLSWLETKDRRKEIKFTTLVARRRLLKR